MRYNLLRTFLAALVMVTTAAAQFTQRSGISGLVTDSSGARIPNASVVLTDVDRNQTYNTSTNDQGLYSFTNLTAGRYTAAAELSGFKKSVSETVPLSADSSLRIDLTLEVGAVTESVRVTTGAPPLLQVEQAVVGQSIDRQMIEALPLLGRNITSLAVLAPNISTYPKPNYGGVTTVGANHAAGGAFVVPGGGGNTGFYMNGVNINDDFLGWIQYSPSPESVSEQRVDSANFSASSGRDASQVTFQTRSGSNQFHGSGFEFFQNSELNAWNPYTKSTLTPGTKKPLFQRNRFGGSLGGPILRDRAFFFINYEGSNENVGGSTSTARLPNAAERQGDFSSFLTRFSGDPNYLIYDPTTTVILPNGNSSRNLFPNNRIPQAMLHADARALLELYPGPSGYVNPNNAADLNNTQFYSATGNYNWRIDSRVDYRFTQNDSVYFSLGKSHGMDRAVGGLFPELNRKREDESYVWTVNYARIFTPHLTNELIYGRSRAKRASVDPETQAYMQDTSLLKNKFFENLGTAANFGFFGITLTGYPIYGFTEVLTLNNPKITFSDNLSWLRGSHTLKFGVQYLSENRTALNWQRVAAFTKTYTRSGSDARSLGGDALADFLVGIPTSLRQQFAFQNEEEPWRDFRTALWGFYAEDKWQVTSKLTLNLGLRYDLPIPTWSQNRFGLAIWDGSYPGGGHLVMPGRAPDLPQHHIPAAKTNFAPRVGLAYRPTNSFVVRANYGIFFQAGTMEMLGNQGSAVNAAGDGGETFDNARYGIHNDLPYFNFDSIFPAQTQIPLGTYPISTGTGTGYFAGRTQRVLYRDNESNKVPYYQRWTLDLQKSLDQYTVVSLTYLGGHGTSLTSYPDQNLPGYRTGWVSTAAFNTARPLGGERFAELRRLRHDYNSHNHSGTIKVQRNLYQGLQFVAHYTFSKTVTDLGTWTGLADLLTGLFIYPNTWDYNRRLGHGEAVTSHPHRFISAVTYQTPWWLTLPAVPKALLWGWQISAITTFESGDAVSAVNVQTSARDGEPNMPNITGGPYLSRGERSTRRYFNASVFSTPPQDVKGTAGVGIIRAPGQNNWNVSLAKVFSITERIKMNFRADMYNVFNHAQWNNLDLNYSTAQGNTFGWVTSAREPRVLELGLRLSF